LGFEWVACVGGTRPGLMGHGFGHLVDVGVGRERPDALRGAVWCAGSEEGVVCKRWRIVRVRSTMAGMYFDFEVGGARAVGRT
jgi:hypothetical protein